MRNAETVLGIIRIAADTGEPGAPKGARPVRGGADGKVLTEQLASRLLHLDHCCEAWNKLTDRPWLIMSIGLRDWAHRL